jgi:hypothetical protein
MTYDRYKTRSDLEDAFDDDPRDQGPGEEPPYCDHCGVDVASKRLGCEALCDACFEEMCAAEAADRHYDIMRE